MCRKKKYHGITIFIVRYFVIEQLKKKKLSDNSAIEILLL